MLVPRRRLTDRVRVEELFAGEGEMASRMRAVDWAATPLGPVERWPAALRTTVRTLLASRHPMFLWWGPELIQFYNDAYLPSFGRGKHPAALGQRGEECWPEIWPIISPQIDDVMRRGVASWHEDQLVPIFRNGSIEQVYWTYGYSPVYDDAGAIGGTLVVCTETTARVLSDQARHASEERLRQVVQEQVQALDRAETLAEELRKRASFEQQLIGIVSHDLRNPVTAILVGAASLLRSDDLDERKIKSVVRIQSSAERAHRMIHDLLDFTQARLGGGLRVEPRPMDLHELLLGVLNEVEATHAGRELQFSRGEDGRGIWDQDRLAQVAQNLLTNAIKYSPEGTPIQVETRNEDGWLVLSVRNQGAPIPPERLSQLFEPLQRATSELDRAGRSVGLGLYIVKQVVDAHGGEIAVESTAGSGTVFTVRLPQPARGGGKSPDPGGLRRGFGALDAG
jgi:signal transduction histidine kinase